MHQYRIENFNQKDKYENDEVVIIIINLQQY